MKAEGRVMHAALQLLDRQLVDRDHELCGKVDDVELTDRDDTGAVYVSALLSGSGALLARTGHARLGNWLRRFVAAASTNQSDDPVRIPIGRVADIGNRVTLSLDREQMATFASEKWVRDHIISHIPGSDHRAPG